MNKNEFFEIEENREKYLLSIGIKNIELLLENCEIITIPGECIGEICLCIGEICLKEFEKTFQRRAINDVSLTETCKYAILQIKNSEQTYKERYTISPTYVGKENSLLERLKCNDITSIQINFLWNAKYHWYIDWCIDNEYINKYQTTEEHFGDIWIAIGKNAQKELKYYYPESQEDRDFQWQIWDKEYDKYRN